MWVSVCAAPGAVVGRAPVRRRARPALACVAILCHAWAAAPRPVRARGAGAARRRRPLALTLTALSLTPLSLKMCLELDG